MIPVVYALDPGTKPAGVDKLVDTFHLFIQASVMIAFVALTAMLFYAGVKFITSAGDPKNLQQARYMAMWAVGGIVFLALSIVVLLLIESFTGVKVTSFCISFNGCPA